MPAGIVDDSVAQFKSNVLNDVFKEIKELSVPIWPAGALKSSAQK
jgi:hypothetical protein